MLAEREIHGFLSDGPGLVAQDFLFLGRPVRRCMVGAAFVGIFADLILDFGAKCGRYWTLFGKWGERDGYGEEGEDIACWDCQVGDWKLRK